MRRIDLIRRALTTWDYFGPISYSKILWAKSYEPSRAKRSPVTKCDQKTPYRRKSAKSHFRAKITKITDFHRKRYPSELGLLNRIEVQNGSSRAQLFKNPIFVAGRNFWRQHFFHLWVWFWEISWFLPMRFVAARNFYRQHFSCFWKVQDEEMHFAPSTAPKAISGADIGSFEVCMRKISFFEKNDFFEKADFRDLKKARLQRDPHQRQM